MRIRGLQFIKISCEGDQLAIPRRPRIGHGPDQTDRSLAMDQTKQTDYWEWARRNRPKIGYGPERTDPRLGMDQTKQIDVWVLARSNRPKIAYRPDETARCLGIGLTEQTHIRYWPDGAARPKICPDYELGRAGPPCPQLRSFSPYLSWVADFILGSAGKMSISTFSGFLRSSSNLNRKRFEIKSVIFIGCGKNPTDKKPPLRSR